MASDPLPPRPFSIMAKPMGPRCNIDCTYCYYLEKERLFPDERKFRMTPAVLDSHIRQTIEAASAAGMREVPFAWQGGEPTLAGLDFFREAVTLQRRYLPPGMRVSNAFQTNGTLLDDAWGAFLRDEGFLVGISLDGPRAVHDRYRRDRAGRGSFDAVMRGVDVLRRHRVEHNALCTVHRANGGKGHEVYRFLRGEGFEFIQFIPIAERSPGKGLARAPQIDPLAASTDWSVAPRAYGKFLCDVFDIWHRSDIGRVFVQFFEVQVGLWKGLPSSLCVFAETCGDAPVLEHDGSLYACDHYVYPEYRLGRITETPMADMLTSQALRDFGEAKRGTLTAQCRACPFLFACNGGCPKHRFGRSASGETGHNHFCESYRTFFRHARGRLMALACQSWDGPARLAGHGARPPALP